MKKAFLLTFIFILLSRALFLSISPAFFDSLEYLKLFEMPDLLSSLRQVHYPIHPAFLTVFWLFNKIPLGNTLFKTEFLNSLLGFFSCLVLYKIAREFTDQKQALVFTLFSAFTPYFWLSQINLLYEPLLCLLLLFSFYFIVKFGKNDKLIFLHYSAIFFALSFLVSSVSLIYLVVFFGYLWTKNTWIKLFKTCLIFCIYLTSSLIIYGLVISSRNIPFTEIVDVLTYNNPITTKLQAEGWLFFVRTVRNSLVVYFNYLTVPLGGILAALALKEFTKPKNRIFIASWLISFFLLNSIWHTGMFGRLSLLLTLPPLYLLAKLKSRVLLAGLLIFLLIYSAKIVFPYHYQKTPYLLEKEYVESINKADNPLLVISNYEEPYLGGKFDCLVLNSPKTETIWAKEQIDKALSENRKVLFTSQAISAPYYQYDGMQYHILSKRKSHPPTQGEKLIGGYNHKTFKEWAEFDLKIYILINDHFLSTK